jgi:cell division protein ZipA
MELDKTQLQWLLAGIGVIVVALIYLWGIRTRIKEELRRRPRRMEREPALGETPGSVPDQTTNDRYFGELGHITPEHHLADKVLVDVEIRPIQRKPTHSGSAQTGNVETAPEIAPENAPATETRPTPGASEPATETRQQPALSPPPSMTVALTVMAPRQQFFNGNRIQEIAGELGFRLNAEGLFERFPDEETVDEAPELVFSMAHLRKPGSFEPQTLADLTTPGLLLFMRLPGPLESIKALELLVITADQLARKLGGVICDERRNRMTNQALMHLRGEVLDLERRRRLWV